MIRYAHLQKGGTTVVHLGENSELRRGAGGVLITGYHSNKDLSTEAEREEGRMRVDRRWLCQQSQVSPYSYFQLQSSAAQVATRSPETLLLPLWRGYLK